MRGGSVHAYRSCGDVTLAAVSGSRGGRAGWSSWERRCSSSLGALVALIGASGALTGCGGSATADAPSAATGEDFYSREQAIRSPSGRIKCSIERGSRGHRVACTMDESPTASGETAWWRLDETGPVVRFRLTVFQGEAEEMPYGTTYYFSGGASKLERDDSAVHCTMRKTGITCRNRDEHGFRLALGVHDTF